MRNRRFLTVKCFIFFTIIFFSGSTFAQTNPREIDFDTSKTYLLKLKDRTAFVCRYVEKDSLFLVIRTETVSRMEIAFDKMKSIEVIKDPGVKKHGYWFPNPHTSRYFFGPSAFNLKKGEGYYQNAYLLINSASVGITDNISIGAGFEIISTVLGKPIFFVTPKYSFKVAEAFHAGVGALYASVPSFSIDSKNRTGALLVYGVGTYGSTDQNITAGLGWGSVQGEFANRPVISISGMTRISKRVALLSENYLVPGSYDAIVSYGVRFFGEKMSVDFGFINDKDIVKSLFIGIPYLDFVIKFR